MRRQYRADRRAGREERSLEEARSNTEQFFWYCPNSPLVPKVREVVRKPASKPSRRLAVLALAVAACVAAAIWWYL